MKKTIVVAALTLVLSQSATASESSVKDLLRSLCASQGASQAQDEKPNQASQTFSMMNDYERQSCGNRGDDFLEFLIKKYQYRLGN